MKEFTLEDFIKELNKKQLRYLLIGGQAVTLYGSPVVSFDFDFWIDPAEKNEFFKLADHLDLEYKSEAKKKPMVAFFAEEEKIDVFFVKKMVTRKRASVTFESCYEKSNVLKDPSGFTVRVPCIDDLIRLKNCKDVLSGKDLDDIEYLRIIKKKYQA